MGRKEGGEEEKEEERKREGWGEERREGEERRREREGGTWNKGEGQREEGRKEQEEQRKEGERKWEEGKKGRVDEGRGVKERVRGKGEGEERWREVGEGWKKRTGTGTWGSRTAAGLPALPSPCQCLLPEPVKQPSPHPPPALNRLGFISVLTRREQLLEKSFYPSNIRPRANCLQAKVKLQAKMSAAPTHSLGRSPTHSHSHPSTTNHFPCLPSNLHQDQAGLDIL